MHDPSTELAERIAGIVIRFLDERPAPPPSPSAPPVEFLTPSEAAGFLRTTPKALEHLRLRGEGPRWIKVAGRCRYAIADCRAWMQAGVQS